MLCLFFFCTRNIRYLFRFVCFSLIFHLICACFRFVSQLNKNKKSLWQQPKTTWLANFQRTCTEISQLRCRADSDRMKCCSSTNPLSADAPDLTNFTSVEEWLNSIKMTRYLENFHAGGINTMDAVVNLTVKELTELGITLVGHQKKIMNSVQNIRAQIRVNGSEGFLVWNCKRRRFTVTYDVSNTKWTFYNFFFTIYVDMWQLDVIYWNESKMMKRYYCDFFSLNESFM